MSAKYLSSAARLNSFKCFVQNLADFVDIVQAQQILLNICENAKI